MTTILKPTKQPEAPQQPALANVEEMVKLGEKNNAKAGAVVNWRETKIGGPGERP
jgi:hypothetical protein